MQYVHMSLLAKDKAVYQLNKKMLRGRQKAVNGMRLGSIVALVFLSLFSAGQADADSTCTTFVGWLLYQNDAHSPIAKELRCNGERFFVLEGRNGEVIARMMAPVLPNGFSFNYGRCKVNGVLRDDVIASVRHRQKQEWSRSISRVWLLDPKPPGFKVVKPAQIECRNEGYGV
jgi:hypothetical protein